MKLKGYFDEEFDLLDLSSHGVKPIIVISLNNKGAKSYCYEAL
jgi:hypothetical protein